MDEALPKAPPMLIVFSEAAAATAAEFWPVRWWALGTTPTRTSHAHTPTAALVAI